MPDIGSSKQRAVFLDRDGVINRAIVRDGKPYPPMTVDELEVISGTPEALARLKAAGFRLIVVTNQPDVARGRQTREMVETLHNVLRSQLPIDDFRVCYHDDADGCTCRKPLPGLILAAAAEHDLTLPASYLIGDRWRDVDAGQRAGCTSVYIDCDYAERKPSGVFTRVTSLPEAVVWILSQEISSDVDRTG